MPKYAPYFEDALDYFYLSNSDDEYFSSLEEQPGTSAIAFIEDKKVTRRRQQAQRNATAKLKQVSGDTALNINPRLPNDFPGFSGRTASAELIQNVGAPRKVKRWHAASGDFVDTSSSKRGGAKSKISSNKLSAIVEEKPWTLDEESALTNFEADGRIMKKYTEFKKAITDRGLSPTDPRFEWQRWDVKLTHQKEGHALWSARLTISHRVTFILNKEKREVMIHSVGKHA